MSENPLSDLIACHDYAENWEDFQDDIHDFIIHEQPLFHNDDKDNDSSIV